MTQPVRMQLTKEQAAQLESMREVLIAWKRVGKIGMCIAQTDFELGVVDFGLLPHPRAAQLLKMFFPKAYARQVATGLIDKENEY